MIWKKIKGSEYLVSDSGQIKSPFTGKLLSGSKNQKGYLIVEMAQNRAGKRVCRTVHSVVAEAFLGLRPSTKHQINHKSGIKSDNSALNLEYVTCRDNILHCHRKWLHKGRCHPDKVKRIFNAVISGMPMTVASRKFKVSYSVVKSIRSGRRWSFITGSRNANTI